MDQELCVHLASRVTSASSISTDPVISFLVIIFSSLVLVNVIHLCEFLSEDDVCLEIVCRDPRRQLSLNQFRKNILPLAGKGAAPSRFQNTNLLERLVMAASKSTDWYTYTNFRFAFLPKKQETPSVNKHSGWQCRRQ